MAFLPPQLLLKGHAVNDLTLVTLLVPLTLPLQLVNAIESESRRAGQSIPEMLSKMLISACEDRQAAEMESAAAADFTAPSITNPPFNIGTRADS